MTASEKEKSRPRGTTAPESLTARGWKEENFPTPVALKPEAKMASAGLAPDNETGDYQNRSAASKIGGHREVVEE